MALLLIIIDFYSKILRFPLNILSMSVTLFKGYLVWVTFYYLQKKYNHSYKAVVQGAPRERDGTWVKEIDLTRSSPGGRSSELKVGLYHCTPS